MVFVETVGHPIIVQQPFTHRRCRGYVSTPKNPVPPNSICRSTSFLSGPSLFSPTAITQEHLGWYGLCWIAVAAHRGRCLTRLPALDHTDFERSLLSFQSLASCPNGFELLHQLFSVLERMRLLLLDFRYTHFVSSLASWRVAFSCSHVAFFFHVFLVSFFESRDMVGYGSVRTTVSGQEYVVRRRDAAPA